MTGKQLKNAILQLAIQGKLVHQNPADEPASVLLARIRKEKEQLVKAGKLILSKPEKGIKPINQSEYTLPKNWTSCQLVDVCRVFGRIGFRGYTKNDLVNSPKKGAISISPSNMKDYGMDYNSVTYITWEKYEESPEIKIYDGDILIVKTGSSYGKCVLVENLPHESTINPQIAVIKDIKVYSKYLLYFLQSPFAREKYEDFVLGTSIPTFSQLNLLSMEFPLPPLAEQHRIVSKIEELMPLVEEFGAAQEKLDRLNGALPEALKKSILQQAIQGKLVPQDAADEPASVLLAQIRKEKEQLVKAGKLKKKDLATTPITDEEKPFEIPESWEWVRLGEISTYACTKKKINAADAASQLWGLDLEDIEKGGRLLNRKTVGERKAIGDKTFFNKGDILYSKLRPYLLKILVAPEEGICTPEIIPFSCFGDIDKEFIVNVLKSSYVDDYINSVTFGIKMPRVGTETMTSLLIPLPPLAEQKRIVAKIEELMAMVDGMK